MSHNVYYGNEPETLTKQSNYLIYYRNGLTPFDNIKTALIWCTDKDEICTLFEKQCDGYKEVCDIVGRKARQ